MKINRLNRNTNSKAYLNVSVITDSVITGSYAIALFGSKNPVVSVVSTRKFRERGVSYFSNLLFNKTLIA